jgi:AcrR family transcriptional regulator
LSRPVPPRQARSRATVGRILTAAEESFAERGQYGFTMPDVARRAGVSVRTVYQRFATREDLLMSVFDRVYARQDDTLLAAWTDENWSKMTIRQLTDRLVGDLSQRWRDEEPLYRSIMGRRLTVDDDDIVFQHGVEELCRGADRFARAIGASGRAVAHPDPDQAIAFAYRMIIAMSARWTAHEVETQAPEPLPWSPMLDELSLTVAR